MHGLLYNSVNYQSNNHIEFNTLPSVSILNKSLQFMTQLQTIIFMMFIGHYKISSNEYFSKPIISKWVRFKQELIKPIFVVPYYSIGERKYHYLQSLSTCQYFRITRGLGEKGLLLYRSQKLLEKVLVYRVIIMCLYIIVRIGCT